MRFTLLPLMRLTAFAGLALFATAVGLSRAVPEPATFRLFESPRYFGVSGAVLEPPSTRDWLLDAGSGTLRPYAPVPGCRVEYAATSPWSDDEGQPRMVARVSPRDPDISSSGDGYSLTRFPLAGAAVHTEVAGSSIVSGRPCWLPGRSSRVVFPCGDGRLYVQELSDDRLSPSVSPPRPVAWRIPGPDDAPLVLGDVVCPAVPALGARLFVALGTGRDAITSHLAPSRIWWLELDPAGDSITAAGPVFLPGAKDDPRSDQRWPNFAVTPDGRVLLTFLTRDLRGDTWRLKYAPVTLDHSGAPPVVDPRAVRDLGNGFAATSPAFSPDGRWLYQVTRRPTSDAGCLRRFSTTALLDAITSEGTVAAGDVAPR
jgi:WD40-like Beta Propeller Repeat